MAGWGGGADGPGLGSGGLLPLVEGLGGVGGAEALARIAEEGLPCRLRHDGLRGGLVGVGGGAGAHLLEGMHHVQPILPSRSPGPLHPAAEFLQSGCRPPGEVRGGLGGEGSVPGVLERRAEDVDLWWWWWWRCQGERERRWRGLGVEDGYGRRGEREGEVDVGRRWRAWWRLGEREWWWQGLGVVHGYGRRGERGAWRGLWGEGEVDVGRRWRAWRRRGEREQWWRGLGVGVVYGRRGEGEVDMRRRWRSWWRQGERERREWVVEARWRCGECGRRGRVCRAGGEAGMPPFAGPGHIARVRPVRRRRRVLGGLAWCRLVLGGGGEVPRRPWIRIEVWWRQRLVVWVE